MNASDCPLSERELEILSLVARGATNAQVAHELHISANTVKVHLRNIFEKIGVESRTEAVTLAIRRGWIAVGDFGVLKPSFSDEVPSSAVPRPSFSVPKAAGWQKALLVVGLILAALILFWPASGPRAIAPRSPFSDRPPASARAGLQPKASRWAAGAPLLVARARLAVAYVGGKLYAIGGDSAEGVSAVVEEYDPLADSWRRRRSKPTPASNICAAAIGGRIYVPGGYGSDGRALRVLEVYDPAADEWSAGPPLPEPLFAYACAAVGGRLYLFGGCDGSRYRQATWIYDVEAGRWQEGWPMESPAAFLAAGVVEGKVYVLGGYDGSAELSACRAYDPAREGSGSPWSACAPMSSRRAGLGVAVVGGNLFAIGGGWDGYLYYNERYDALNDAWAGFETPILGQWRTLGVAAGAVGQEEVIFAVGGWSGDFLAVNERYSPLFRVSLPRIP